MRGTPPARNDRVLPAVVTCKTLGGFKLLSLWKQENFKACRSSSVFFNYYHWESGSRSVVSDCLRPHGLYSPWNSPGQNTGVGSLSLLQGIFPTQGSNPGLPPLQADSLPAEATREAHLWEL